MSVFRVISKIGLLLVVIGFFMPVACSMNGFQIAELSMNSGQPMAGVFLYLLFISALLGAIVGIPLFMGKKIPAVVDWVLLLACIASGIGALAILEIEPEFFETGAYVILIGWIVALVTQIVGTVKKEGARNE